MVKLTISTLVFSLALGKVIAYSQTAAADSSAAQPKPKQAFILPFAVANNAASSPGPSGNACPNTLDPNDVMAGTQIRQKLIDTISSECKGNLPL